MGATASRRQAAGRRRWRQRRRSATGARSGSLPCFRAAAQGCKADCSPSGASPVEGLQLVGVCDDPAAAQHALEESQIGVRHAGETGVTLHKPSRQSRLVQGRQQPGGLPGAPDQHGGACGWSICARSELRWPTATKPAWRRRAPPPPARLWREHLQACSATPNGKNVHNRTGNGAGLDQRQKGIGRATGSGEYSTALPRRGSGRRNEIPVGH